MHFNSTNLAQVIMIEPDPHEDERGRFMRAWCLQEFGEQGLNFLPMQANLGFSPHPGTIRGMHFQHGPAREAKLVRCTRGAIFDVALDLRPNSCSYGKWYGVKLSAENGRMIYIPEGCAHGYQTMEENTEMFYFTSQFYTPDAAGGVRYDDPAFNIQWPLEVTVISEQDSHWALTEPRSHVCL